jgi:ABC-type branched-subunit amino acid transport system substrate-binding protein
MNRKSAGLIAAVLSANLFVAVLAKNEAPSAMTASAGAVGVTADKIVIGACLPQSGNLKLRGQGITDAANAYFSYVNEQGGINGRKIDFQKCDDFFDPEKAIICFNNCLKDKVFAQSFCIGSPAIIKYIRMTELQDMPLFGILNGTTAAYEFHKNLFVLRPSYADEAEQQIKQLWDVQHLRKIVLVFESDAYGSSVRRAVMAALHARKGELVKDVSFARGGDDLKDALASAHQSKADAIIIVGHTGVMPVILKTRKDENWHEVCLTYSSVDDAVSRAGALSEDMIITQAAPRPDEHLPAAAQYFKLLKKYSPHTEPEPGAFEAFLNAMVLVEALKRCGTDVTRPKFVSAMESLHNYDLGAGDQFKVNFSATNHQGWPSSSVSFGIFRQGKLVPMTAADWTRVIQQSKQ